MLSGSSVPESEARPEAAQIRAAGSDNELLDALERIDRPGRILGTEPFIMVIVSIEDDVDISGMHDCPQPLHCRIAPPPRRAEQGHMKICHSAEPAVVRYVATQPFLLLAALGNASVDGELTVLHDHMPLTDIVAVESLERRSGLVSEVAIVRRAAVDLIVVVADGRPYVAHDLLRRISP